MVELTTCEVELTTGPVVVVPGTTGPTPPFGSAVVVIA